MAQTPNTVLRLRREQRRMRLVGLGYRSYSEYLRSAHWAQVRVEYVTSPSSLQDCICGETERLQLHHTTYERIGAEELTDLTPLCPTCHAMIHTLEARGEIGLDFTGFVSDERAKRHAFERQRFLDRQESWSILHAEKRGEQKVAEIKRATKDLVRRAEKMGVDPAPGLQRILKLAQWTRHELENAAA